MKSSLPTRERLLEVLRYNQETGEFTWKNTMGSRAPAGGVAGAVNKSGYRVIRVDGRLHYGHRLAWLIVYGLEPVGGIDHRDGHKGNNAISNLREATDSVNMQNQRRATRQNKTTGLLGASMDKRDGRYVARITVSQKHLFLGRFDRPEDAHTAYIEAKRRHHAGCTV